MSENQLQKQIFGKFANPFSVRLSDDETKYILDNWEDLTGQTEMNIPARKFFLTLVDGALNTKPKEKIVEVSKQTDIDLIQQLQSSIEDLQINNTSVTELQNRIDQLLNDNKELSESLISITSEKFEIESKLQSITTEKELIQQRKFINDNEVVIAFTHFEHAVINHVCANESASTKKDITPAVLLHHMFITQVQRGAYECFEPISNSKLKEIQKTIS